MVTGLADVSKFPLADLIMQEVGVVTAFSAYEKLGDLQQRLYIQPFDLWSSMPTFLAECLPFQFVLTLVNATLGDREFEYEVANMDLGLLCRIQHVHTVVLEQLIAILN